jgi:hypothetical protein
VIPFTSRSDPFVRDRVKVKVRGKIRDNRDDEVNIKS